MIDDGVDNAASLEEIAYHERCLQVIVHGIIALLPECCHEVMNIAVALSLRCYALNVCQSVHELLHTLLAGLQGIVGEVYCSTIVCREYEEPDGHRRVRLLERRVVACEELFQGDEVAEALSHLLSVDGNHIVVHPVFHHLVSLRCHGLCYLALMMWEYEVHASAVDIEVVAEIFPSHGRTLAVPSRKSVAPW